MLNDSLKITAAKSDKMGSTEMALKVRTRTFHHILEGISQGGKGIASFLTVSFSKCSTGGAALIFLE